MPRFVFAADPAVITEAVDEVQQKRVVYFAGARLVPARIVGQLKVSDPRQEAFNGIGQFAFHALHMIDVVLQFEIGRADLIEERDGLRGAVQEEARNVVSVDRLREKSNARILQFRCGELQIFRKRSSRDSRLHARGRDPGKAIDLSAIKGLCVVDGLADAVLKFGYAIRIAGDAALSCLPVSSGQVE